MPRQARLEVPGALHHIMVRGIDKSKIFRDNEDKARCPESSADLQEKAIGLNAIIRMPNVRSCMGAVLFCKEGKPKCLETYTFGEEPWDGIFDGFSIEQAP